MQFIANRQETCLQARQRLRHGQETRDKRQVKQRTNHGQLTRAILDNMETLTRDNREAYQTKGPDSGQIYKAKDRA